MRWRRFSLGLVLGGILLAGPSGAAADPAPAGPLALSLDEAVSRGAAAGTAALLAAEDLERARITLEQARDAARAMPDPVTLDAGRAKALAPRQAEMGLRVAEKALAAARDNLALGVQKAYFGAVLARDLVEVRRLSVRLAETQAAAARTGYESGSRARTDVLMAEAQLATARADLATAEKDLKVALMNLDRAVGLPLDTALELTTPLQDRPPAAIDLLRALAGARAASLERLQAAEAVEVARLDRDLAERFTARNTYVYRLADAAYRQALARLDAREVDVEIAVRKGILEIADAQERIAQQKKAVAFAEEGLRLAELRYRAGVGTGAEVLDAQVRLGAARTALANARFAYEMARAQFAALTGGAGG